MNNFYTTSSYTTIEQGTELLKLGLNPETADMYYEMIDQGLFLNIKQGINSPKDSIPCWSVMALLDLIPVKLAPILTRGRDFPEESDDWFCYLDDNKHFGTMFHSSSQIEAVYSMVVYLIANNYIKTKQEDEQHLYNTRTVEEIG